MSPPPHGPTARITLLLLTALTMASCATRPLATEHGLASYHAPFILGRDAKTASGERWINFKMVAAHQRLPFGTIVRVTNLENNKSADVRIIDRGPYVRGRVIDVSKRAARKLGMIKRGVVRVRLDVIEWP